MEVRCTYIIEIMLIIEQHRTISIIIWTNNERTIATENSLVVHQSFLHIWTGKFPNMKAFAFQVDGTFDIWKLVRKAEFKLTNMPSQNVIRKRKFLQFVSIYIFFSHFKLRQFWRGLKWIFQSIMTSENFSWHHIIIYLLDIFGYSIRYFEIDNRIGSKINLNFHWPFLNKT